MRAKTNFPNVSMQGLETTSQIEVTPGESEEPLSAERFVALLRRSNPWWWRTEDHTDFDWVFRGHRDAAWKLQPTAWREGQNQCLAMRGLIADSRKMDFVQVEGIKCLSTAEPGDSQELTIRCAAELEALGHFSLFSNSLGLPVPRVAEKPSEARQVNATDIEYLDELVPILGPIAQHHGIPTRLLDWTEDPLHAAFFAIGDDREQLSATPIAVWALNTRIFARHPEWYVRVFDGDRHANTFLRAQAGKFTEMLLPYRFFLEYKRWPHIEDWIMKDHVNFASPRRHPYSEPIPALRKIVLPQSEVADLRKLLIREGLSKARAMPTFDNVAQDLISRWKSTAERA